MWHKTFYGWQKWPLKEWAAGCAIGPFVFIRQGYQDDDGLHQHELVHLRPRGTCPLKTVFKL